MHQGRRGGGALDGLREDALGGGWPPTQPGESTSPAHRAGGLSGATTQAPSQPQSHRSPITRRDPQRLPLAGFLTAPQPSPPPPPPRNITSWETPPVPLRALGR